MARHTKSDSVSSKVAAVRYPDGSGLSRPLDLPRANFPIVIAIVIAAAIVGIWGGYTLYDNIANSQARSEAEVSAVVNRGVTMNTPVLSTYVGLDDATILANMTAAGLTYFDMNSINTSSTSSLDIFKLPSDVTVADAAVTYAKGISSLKANEAAKYLSGSYRLTISRSEYFDMKMKYADFSSGSTETALANALTAQGFASTTLVSSGTDTSGNLYQTGTMDIGGATYGWSVSVCPLSYVYSIDGLPSNAQYVGVRIYQ